MQGADAPSRAPKTLFTFHSSTDIQEFVTGCDADIGGSSSVHLDLDPSSSPSSPTNAGTPTARFWGTMSLSVKPGLEGKIRAGYAGFRNKVLASPPPFRVSPLGDRGESSVVRLCLEIWWKMCRVIGTSRSGYVLAGTPVLGIRTL
jgi:hypothetical protein